MKIELLSSVPEEIILMGFSCVGKTSFARLIENQYHHTYHSFDSSYRLYGTKIPGLSPRLNWTTILSKCKEHKFVLDNWSTEDTDGRIAFKLKPHICFFVLVDYYDDIIDRYRIPVPDRDAFTMMYKKMYLSDRFVNFRDVRYFWSKNGNYEEITASKMHDIASRSFPRKAL